MQVQFVKAALPAGELEFVGQALHVEAPTAVEYFPVPQSVHAVTDDEPLMTEYLPAAHAMQSDSASLQYSNHCPELRLVGPAPIVPAYALALQISIPEQIFQNASVLQNKYREP